MDKIPPVLLLGDPLLRRVSQPVTTTLIQSSHFKHQCNQLKVALQRFRNTFGFGRAIAAPQISMRCIQLGFK